MEEKRVLEGKGVGEKGVRGEGVGEMGVRGRGCWWRKWC